MNIDPDRVTVTIDDAGVATVTMVRADKHNALDPAMMRSLVAAAQAVGADSRARVVVLHGQGASFCSGLDLSVMAGGIDASDELIGREPGQVANLAQRTGYEWQQLPIPVIAAMHGNCFENGLQVALGADMRITAPEAQLSIMEVRWGLIPDMSITQTLPHLVARDVAMELMMTGRVVTGTEAATLGLVTQVAPDPLAAAHQLATQIAAKSPDAIRASKQLIHAAWPANNAAAALNLETELQLQMLASANHREAVAAGLEARTPEFTDPQ